MDILAFNMFTLKFLNKISILLLLSLVCINSLYAVNDDLGMFEKDAARTVFGSDMQVIVAKYEFSKQPDAGKPKDTPENDIIKDFGNPDEPYKVHAVDNAPKPFKGMIAAVRDNNLQLAYKYALQYEQYLQDLENVNREAVALWGKAKVAKGSLPEDSWVSAPQFDQYNDLVAKVKQDYQEQKKEKTVTKGQISAETKKLLDTDLFSGSVEEKQNIAKTERALAREELTGKLPSISTGKIDIFFFFQPYQQASIDTGKELAKFYSEYNEDSDVNVLGFSVESGARTILSGFANRTGAKFKLAAGNKLAKELGVEKTPSVMLVNPLTTEFNLLSGSISANYLDEAVNIIRGK